MWLSNLFPLVDTNQRYGGTAVDEQTRALKAIDNARNRQQLSTLMKGWRLVWTVDDCRGNTVGCVARSFGYLTLLFEEVLLEGGVDSRYSVLEVWVGAALGAALPPVSIASLSLSEATARAIATVTRVMAYLLTIKAFDRTLILLLSESCAGAWRVWPSAGRTACNIATSSATSEVASPWWRLLKAAKCKPTKATARPTTSKAEAENCTRCRWCGVVSARNSNGWRLKPSVLRCFGKSLWGFQYNALSRLLLVEAVCKLLDENVLEHHSVCCFRVNAMLDKLDVAYERLDAFALFLTPEFKPLSKLLWCLSNGKIIFKLRLSHFKMSRPLKTEVLSHLKTFNVN